MGKGIYLGVDGVARKVKKAYIGVDGTARKVKKVYLGVGGKARPALTGGELVYYGSSEDGAVDELSTARKNLSAASAGPYAFFSHTWESANSSCDVYNLNLTHTVLTNGTRASNRASVSFDQYAMFGGGRQTYPNVSTVTTYNFKLVLSEVALSKARGGLPAVATGNYALFGPGSGYKKNSDGTWSSPLVPYVEAFDKTLTHTVVNTASKPVQSPAEGTHAGEYAIFGNSTYLEAYDKTLTLISIEGGLGKDSMQASAVRDYAIFARETTALAFNASLTRSVIAGLSESKYSMETAETAEHAVFAGGMAPNNIYSSSVDVYDESLTHSTVTNLAKPSVWGAATSLAKYILVAGGEMGSGSMSKAVSVYRAN